MYRLDVYLRVRRAVMVEGMSIRDASRVFGLESLSWMSWRVKLHLPEALEFIQPLVDGIPFPRNTVLKGGDTSVVVASRLGGQDLNRGLLHAMPHVCLYQNAGGIVRILSN